GLGPVLDLAPRDVDIGGLVFREVLSVTQIHGGIATNVIPARCEAIVNFRYAPGRSLEDEEARVRELVGRDLEVVHHSPAAHVALSSSLVTKPREAGDFEV